MKILGFYSELWPSRAGVPEGSIGNYASDVPVADEERLVSYLKDGDLLFAAMGAEKDVLGSGEYILGAGSLFTDGEWVWRGDLWFYLSTYHVRLPESFVSKVRSLNYMVPNVSEERALVLTDEVESLLTW
ncbi:hypothetical protein HUT19_07955 [Streptomyces sp. NA02950]|uniref:hypothetical protein n=1 Tax=Streptomyces sp. NA02950 TaxID=2742137 RepID=UPI0015923A4F|nr:hypothetical protein [Streptomyces sp. NA02950]QKV91691.1 hypothetical protein HUT19_07955 [Streptomyces sp. NA02950]